MELEKIVIRCARPDELPSIIALLAADQLGAKREDASMPLAKQYEDAFEAIDGDPNQILVVALDDKLVVGTQQLTFIPGLSRGGSWRCQIEAVRVAKSHRNKGLGEFMFEWAINKAKTRGCRLVQLTTDKTRPDAHRFYERLGFQANHVGYKKFI